MKLNITALLLSAAASAYPARYVTPSQPERYQVQNLYTENVDETQPFKIVQDVEDTDDEKVDQDVKVEKEITDEENKDLKDEAKEGAPAATSLTSLIVQDDQTPFHKIAILGLMAAKDFWSSILSSKSINARKNKY